MLYTISNKYLSVTVNSEGGSMTSVKYLPLNEERQWQGDDFWKSQDVVIFPIIGHAGAYNARGGTFTPKSHGVARYSAFTLADKSGESITLALSSNEETLKTYPYEFDFSITYKLIEKSVEVTYFVRSKDGKIPFYVGGHPGMKAPRGEAVIEFENEENPVLYPVDCAEGIEVKGLRRFVANKAFFAECKTFQLGSLSGGDIYAYTADGYRYTYSSDCPVVAFWSNEKGGDYICVEPWWGINDFPSAPREITLKPFMNFADREGKTFSYRLTVEKI